MTAATSKYPSADVAPVLEEVAIPEPGTSDARSGRWLGFGHDCECHVADNSGEEAVACTEHVVDNRSNSAACGHLISPECLLHRGWKPGDTALIARRPGAFVGDPGVPDEASATR
jgi:hypothetical protein